MSQGRAAEGRAAPSSATDIPVAEKAAGAAGAAARALTGGFLAVVLTPKFARETLGKHVKAFQPTLQPTAVRSERVWVAAVKFGRW